jgi:hypothetical protein
MMHLPGSLLSDLSPSNSEVDLNQEITLEALRQARHSFNLAQQSFQAMLVMTIVSGVASLMGAGLLLTGKVTEGSVTTAAGLVSGVSFLQFTKEASDRLEKANKRLDKVSEAHLAEGRDTES